MKTYTHHGEFPLESGGSLKDITIAYHTYGTLSARADNVVWVCHALTANSDVADWWPGTVAPGRFLDPERYGSTGPLSVNPDTGEPYYRTFPRLTMRDVVAAHRILADALGIGRIHAIIGSSVGGFQAVEWAVAEPERFGRVALIATDAKASPWTIAIDETQRMAILADPSYALDRPDGGAAGLAAARAIGLLTYRGGSGYNITQQDATDDYTVPHRACTYQRYQGSKLVGRFDAYSYMAILDTFDTHNVGRGRGTLRDALARITAPTIVVGLGTDIIFTPGEMQTLASMIPGAEYRQIESPFGHDGFLVEADRLNEILLPFIEG